MARMMDFRTIYAKRTITMPTMVYVRMKMTLRVELTLFVRRYFAVSMLGREVERVIIEEF